ncbi:MAG: alpha/beta fold hydrolase [Planctomycetes bacterium]|nr:alpha/beta fold hydrolase [Planctomycetota bacterium]
MHYLDEGSGPPLLMLHGNPTWSFYFRDLVKGLRDQYRVIVPDHIGCGLSDKPRQYPYTLSTHIDNVERLVDHLGLASVTLMVHDWGGPIGFGWAVRHPNLVSALTVFNTAAFLDGTMPTSPGAPGALPVRIRVSGWPVLGTIAVLWFNAFARAATRMAVHKHERMTTEVRRGYLLPYDTPDHRIAVLCFVRDIPFTPRVPSYRVFEEIESGLAQFRDRPMTIFWGMRDFCFTPKFLSEWVRRFPGATVHRYDDAGHYVIEDAHERIVPILRQFLSRGTPTTA